MIWCVEDDSGIRDIIIYALKSAGFETRGFEDGLAFWEAIEKEKPDLVILDVMLPGMNGIDILKKLKESVELNHIPVIVATARGQEYDRIYGLDLGADDYIVKPFSVMEMVSRVKAVLRRTNPNKAAKVLKYKDLVVNLEEHSVSAGGSRIVLTYKEFELLRMFITRPGMVYTREELYNLVWHTDFMGDSRTLDTHIRTLRHKLGDYGKFIRTIRNIGYQWEAAYDK